MKECTAATARCADARDYSHALRDCCRAHVRHVTQAVTDALAAAKIQYWADYGTLMGAVRNPLTTHADYPWLTPPFSLEPGIVPHDKDSDIGVLIADWAPAVALMRKIEKANGFNLVVRPHRGSMKVRLSRTNHTNIDIFFWYARPDGTMFRRGYARVDAFKGREFHRSILFPLGTVQWEGLTLPAPHEPEQFLQMRYGPNWRTPIAANNDAVLRP